MWFSNEGAFSSSLHSRDIMVILAIILVVTFEEEGDIDIYWVEVNITIKQPTVHRTTSHNKGSVVPNLNNTWMEKFWSVLFISWVLLSL